jgi:hypothetical protein
MKKLKLNPPLMPNFVFDTDGRAHDIADFTKEEAEQYADLMRETVMKHWEKRKAQKKALKELTNENE